MQPGAIKARMPASQQDTLLLSLISLVQSGTPKGDFSSAGLSSHARAQFSLQISVHGRSDCTKYKSGVWNRLYHLRGQKQPQTRALIISCEGEGSKLPLLSCCSNKIEKRLDQFKFRVQVDPNLAMRCLKFKM